MYGTPAYKGQYKNYTALRELCASRTETDLNWVILANGLLFLEFALTLIKL
jgi:hypothetical protein